MAPPPSFDALTAMICEVKRELGMRVSVYPRMVAAHKLKKATADLQLALMRDVLAFLESTRDDAAPE